MDQMFDDLSWDWEMLDRDEVKDYVEKNGVSGIEAFLKKKLDHWKEIEINVAITGFSGTGKSSFINTIRGLRDDEPRSAKVGVVETTIEPTSYQHPTNEKIKFWDLPGIGTPKYPDLPTYCKEVNLEFYDTYLLFTSSRFTEYDLELARKVRSLRKNFFFIRTKIDDSARAEKRKRSYNEEVMLDEIRQNCSTNLGDLLNDVNEIFLISNHYPSRWDFARLTQAILDVLPIRQRESLTLSLGVLTSLSVDILQRKVDLLNGRIWKVAAASAAVALVPLPGLSIGVDLALITSELCFYRSQLGLPEEGSDEFARLKQDNQEKIRKFVLTTAAQVASLMVAYGAESTVEEFARFIPFVGLVIASGLSFSTTYYFLQRCLNDMKKTALEILDDVSASSISDLDID